MKKTKTNKTTLELLSEKSHNAINLVLTTIESLKDTNRTIDDEKKKNDELIVSIQTTNNSLIELKSGNEKIISNFEKLLQ
jgi:hypothetical protein